MLEYEIVVFCCLLKMNFLSVFFLKFKYCIKVKVFLDKLICHKLAFLKSWDFFYHFLSVLVQIKVLGQYVNNYPHPPFYLKSLTCLKNKKSINFKDQGTNWCPITELNFLIQSKCQVSSPNMPIPHQTRATLYIKQLNVMFCVASWHKVFWHGHNHHLALIKFRRGWKVPSLCKLCILMTYNFGCYKVTVSTL